MTTTYHPYPTEPGLFADRGVTEYRVATSRIPGMVHVSVQALDAQGKVLAADSHSAMLFATLRRMPRI